MFSHFHQMFFYAAALRGEIAVDEIYLPSEISVVFIFKFEFRSRRGHAGKVV
jgi:hypothetical protein